MQGLQCPGSTSHTSSWHQVLHGVAKACSWMVMSRLGVHLIQLVEVSYSTVFESELEHENTKSKSLSR